MVTATFDQIPGLAAMQPGAPIPLFSRLPAAWRDEIERLPGVGVVRPEVWTRVNVIEGKRIIAPPRFFFGADIETGLRLKKSIYRDSIIEGRFLTDEDRGTLNAVVSRRIAEEFNKSIGDPLLANGHELTIIGIYHCGQLLLDVSIILDIGQVRSMARFHPNVVSCFYIEQDGTVSDDVLIEQITALFRGRNAESFEPAIALGFGTAGGNVVAEFFYRLDRELKSSSGLDRQTSERKSVDVAAASKHTRPAAAHRQDETASAIEIRSADEWAERFDEFSADLDVFLTIMTGIGVTIAVLSTINTMLMSVSERIIEFGILKANGWTKADIMKLITCESTLLGLGGGLLGCLLGWSGTHAINWTWPEHVHLFASPGLLLFSVAFSIVLGVLGGLYPAVWATRMSPMDAIRRG